MRDKPMADDEVYGINEHKTPSGPEREAKKEAGVQIHQRGATSSTSSAAAPHPTPPPPSQTLVLWSTPDIHRHALPSSPASSRAGLENCAERPQKTEVVWSIGENSHPSLRVCVRVHDPEGESVANSKGANVAEHTGRLYDRDNPCLAGRCLLQQQCSWGL